jgi:hypothetical protein
MSIKRPFAAISEVAAAGSFFSSVCAVDAFPSAKINARSLVSPGQSSIGAGILSGGVIEQIWLKHSK